jgi:(hydroxyamino)benzene mutase
VADMNRTDATVSQPGTGESVAVPGSGVVSEESASVARDARATGLVRTADRRLMWHGVFLFLLGLVTGTQERRFTNMRMAISAHLEGVMNGTFLIALGAIWGHVELPPRVEQAARWTALYGTYGNWLFTTLGAAFGTAAANPILSEGHHGKPWQEKVAGLGFRSMRHSILVAVLLVLWGLSRRRSSQDISIASPDSGSTSAQQR